MRDMETRYAILYFGLGMLMLYLSLCMLVGLI